MDTAFSFLDIGLVHMLKQEYANAIDGYKQVLDIYEKILPKNHEFVASVHSSLGMVYAQIGDIRNALDQYNRNLAITIKQYGKTHVKVADAYMAIAWISQQDANKFEEVQDYLDNALTIYESDPVGPNKKKISMIYLSKSFQAFVAQKYEDAMHLFEQWDKEYAGVLEKDFQYRPAVDMANFAKLACKSIIYQDKPDHEILEGFYDMFGNMLFLLQKVPELRGPFYAVFSSLHAAMGNNDAAIFFGIWRLCSLTKGELQRRRRSSGCPRQESIMILCAVTNHKIIL